MTGPVDHRPFDLFCGPILSAFCEVLSQVSGESWKTEAAPAEAAEAGVEVGFQCRGRAHGPFAFRMSVAAALGLAKLLTGEAIPEGVGELSGDNREALEELLRQIVGIAATRAEAGLGKTELAFVGSSTTAQDDEQFPFSVKAASEALCFYIRVGKELRESLLLAASEAATEAKEAEPQPREAGLPSPTRVGALTQEAIREGNLELLWDVALSLTLRFGQRELLLKEILELSPGVVLELDRQVDEPVDLLLDRKLIARGEVVIVDGNYGLRITEVASAAEKLACLP